MSFNGNDLRTRRMRSKINRSMDVRNLFGDPFAISTISIAIISWVIAIVGSIAAASTNETFPRFTWWGIAYQFLLLVILVLLYSFDTVDYYKNFLTGAFSVAFVYNTNSATNLVYATGSKKAAAAAGVILLSVINLIWIFYYGGDNASPTNRWIDSFSLKGIKVSAYENTIMRTRRRTSRNAVNNRRTSRFMPMSPGFNNVKHENYMSSNALTGFENADPLATQMNSSHTNIEIDTGLSDQPVLSAGSNNNTENTFLSVTSNGSVSDTTMGDTLGLYSDIGDDNFKYTAKTLYSYQADDADQYEISFEQGEILKVSDIEGRWWKARRANGETGIIPSNYVQLIDDDADF
ncbi:similar to Saccharomyces cerevisiae YER118C SHO1 Transmembrane osmosensor [Maudiozyma saulgeensis]|uniref:High osmolarity signaling protein SHO1 n=1 Tax=Maudiozyma saulgeensis TaxID=1789683 RepID=A0A1X7QYG1_9SACH|nr:similar to Saccharomyces cerevisiae YER118C SHO1 Transmembrane osmosensor [Kazachstania saulgeensis]